MRPKLHLLINNIPVIEAQEATIDDEEKKMKIAKSLNKDINDITLIEWGNSRLYLTKQELIEYVKKYDKYVIMNYLYLLGYAFIFTMLGIFIMIMKFF